MAESVRNPDLVPARSVSVRVYAVMRACREDLTILDLSITLTYQLPVHRVLLGKGRVGHVSLVCAVAKIALWLLALDRFRRHGPRSGVQPKQFFQSLRHNLDDDAHPRVPVKNREEMELA
jgi:hypothetical protein